MLKYVPVKILWYVQHVPEQGREHLVEDQNDAKTYKIIKKNFFINTIFNLKEFLKHFVNGVPSHCKHMAFSVKSVLFHRNVSKLRKIEAPIFEYFCQPKNGFNPVKLKLCPPLIVLAYVQSADSPRPKTF